MLLSLDWAYELDVADAERVCQFVDAHDRRVAPALLEAADESCGGARNIAPKTGREDRNRSLWRELQACFVVGGLDFRQEPRPLRFRRLGADPGRCGADNAGGRRIRTLGPPR
jgi:hypothetical protein